MSRGSTFRRATTRARGIDGGSIRKQQPNSKHNLLWLIEKARREYMRRQHRLDNAAGAVAYYWGIFMKQYPDEARAILEQEQIMLEEQRKARETEPGNTEGKASDIPQP